MHGVDLLDRPLLCVVSQSAQLQQQSHHDTAGAAIIDQLSSIMRDNTAKPSSTRSVLSNLFGGKSSKNEATVKKSSILDVRDISSTEIHVPDSTKSEDRPRGVPVFQRRRHRDFAISQSFSQPFTDRGISTSPEGMEEEQMDKLEAALME